MDTTKRVTAYAVTNGFANKYAGRFDYSLWNAAFVCTPKQYRRVFKKYFRDMHKIDVPF
ncbi:MAG: hypothetical protein HMLIMOIP_002076 [Candidatus Nitrosomirales archaeon]|jgi:hypothetical protein